MAPTTTKDDDDDDMEEKKSFKGIWNQEKPKTHKKNTIRWTYTKIARWTEPSA